jgi:hypothetical protein
MQPERNFGVLSAMTAGSLSLREEFGGRSIANGGRPRVSGRRAASIDESLCMPMDRMIPGLLAMTRRGRARGTV